MRLLIGRLGDAVTRVGSFGVGESMRESFRYIFVLGHFLDLVMRLLCSNPPPPPRPITGLSKHGDPVFPYFFGFFFGTVVFAVPIGPRCALCTTTGLLSKHGDLVFPLFWGPGPWLDKGGGGGRRWARLQLLAAWLCLATTAGGINQNYGKAVGPFATAIRPRLTSAPLLAIF